MKMQKVFNDICSCDLGVNFLFDTRINCSHLEVPTHRSNMLKKSNKAKQKQNSEFLFATLQQSLT